MKSRVQEHVDSLSQLIANSVFSHEHRAARYVFLLRRLAMKTRTRLPGTIKRQYCKHCYTPFAPGRNSRVRTRNGMLVYTCFTCKNYTRVKLSP